MPVCLDEAIRAGEGRRTHALGRVVVCECAARPHDGASALVHWLGCRELAAVRPLLELVTAPVLAERDQQNAVELEARRAVEPCVGAVPVSDAPPIRDGQDVESEPDALTSLRQLRPIRPDLVGTPQRLIERSLPVGAIGTEQSGGQIRVPLLPGALKPGAQLSMMTVRTQSARTVPRVLLKPTGDRPGLARIPSARHRQRSARPCETVPERESEHPRNVQLQCRLACTRNSVSPHDRKQCRSSRIAALRDLRRRAPTVSEEDHRPGPRRFSAVAHEFAVDSGDQLGCSSYYAGGLPVFSFGARGSRRSAASSTSAATTSGASSSTATRT
jgi:hypothetical protein